MQPDPKDGKGVYVCNSGVLVIRTSDMESRGEEERTMQAHR